MTPGQCNNLQGKNVLIRDPKAGAMIAEHVFDTPDGLAWLESGCLNTGHQSVTGIYYYVGKVHALEAGCWVLETPHHEEVLLDIIPEEATTGDRKAARRLLERELGICLTAEEA